MRGFKTVLLWRATLPRAGRAPLLGAASPEKSSHEALTDYLVSLAAQPPIFLMIAGSRHSLVKYSVGLPTAPASIAFASTMVASASAQSFSVLTPTGRSAEADE